MTGLVCLADVQPEQISWLWPGRIPAGKLITLDGDPCLGKSALALTIAATVTRAGQWPDGTRCERPGDVLIMSAEDGLADTIRPRVDAAGGDLTRVHVIEHGLDATGQPMALTLGETDQIERHITETAASLLIIDVLMAYMPGDAYKDQNVRKALTPLAKVAERTDCAMLLLRHVRKSKGGEPVHLGGGSIGIAGAARAGFIVARDPDRPDDVRLLASVKSNLASPPKSLAYQLVGTRKDSVESVRVEWLGEDERTAADLLRGTCESLGEKSLRVRDFVNSRTETTSAAVAQQLGITPKLASQYLNRLRANGYISQVRRGVYAPSTSSADDTEDTEDGEDSARPSGMAHLGSRCGAGAADVSSPSKPHHLHDLQPVSIDDGGPNGHCRECGSQLGPTGKCVQCIVNRAAAHEQRRQVVSDN